MKVNLKKLSLLSNSDFGDLSLFDWFWIAIEIIKILMSVLESDGNGGLKPKDEQTT